MRAVAREAPRIFRSHGVLDEAWLARRRASLARLGAQLATPGDDDDFLGGALDAIRLVHGDEASTVVARVLDRLGGSGRARVRAERFFAHYALAFDPRPRLGGDPAVTAADFERDAEALARVVRSYGGLALTLDEVLGLEALGLGGDAAAIGKLVAGGLALGDVRRLAELGRAAELAQLDDPEVAGAYVAFASALVPHYTALGLSVPLSPAVFERLRKGTRKEDLAVLAVCLMEHHSEVTPETADLALVRLDATLGLFQRRPAEAASLLAELSGTSKGAGREALPEVAAWLGDDALLNRYVHLARLAGAPVPLSRALRADLNRAARLDERARAPRRADRAHAGAGRAPPPPRRRRGRASQSRPDPAPPRRPAARSHRQGLPAAPRRRLPPHPPAGVGDRGGAAHARVAGRDPLLPARRHQPRPARHRPPRGGRRRRPRPHAPRQPRLDRRRFARHRRRRVARSKGARRDAGCACPPALDRGGPGRGAAHGHPLRHLPGARDGAQRGLHGGQRRRRQQAGHLPARPGRAHRGAQARGRVGARRAPGLSPLRRGRRAPGGDRGGLPGDSARSSPMQRGSLWGRRASRGRSTRGSGTTTARSPSTPRPGTRRSRPTAVRSG